MRRPIVIALGAGAAALFLGCLFPSFDDVKNGDVNTLRPDDDGPDGATKSKDANAGTSSSGSSGSSGEASTSGSGTSASSSSSGDTGAPDTGTTTTPKVISCGGHDCDVATQVCCDGGGGGECKPKGSSCSVWTIRCDDFTDCAAGETCCWPNAGDLELACAKNCNGGPVICTAGKPCAAGTCGGDVPFGPPSVDVQQCK